MRPRRSLPSAVLIAVCWWCEAIAQHPGVVGELNPTAILFHKPHYTSGVEAVERAAQLGCRRINVVATLLCRIQENREVIEYGLVLEGKFRPLDAEVLAKFRAALEATFAAAVEHQLHLAILAHVNTWGEPDDWRNNLLLDPAAECGGYSFHGAMYGTLLDALSATVPSTTEVELALAGEMGRSVFAHGEGYLQSLDALRADPRVPQLRLGVSFNFSQVAGEVAPSEAQSRAVQRLVNKCDFVGFSNYRPFKLPVEPADFRDSIDNFLREIGQAGVTLPEGVPLHFSEIGLGGGSEDGRLAQSPAQAAETPWEGSGRARSNPWRDPALRQLRREYHAALLEFLTAQGPPHPVTQAFFWSEGSWDPQGIDQMAFADEQIIAAIQTHNRKAAATKPDAVRGTNRLP